MTRRKKMYAKCERWELKNCSNENSCEWIAKKILSCMFSRLGTRSALRPAAPQLPNSCSWPRVSCSGRSSRTLPWASTRCWSWTRCMRDTCTAISCWECCVPFCPCAQTCGWSSCRPPSTSSSSPATSATHRFCRCQADSSPFRWVLNRLLKYNVFLKWNLHLCFPIFYVFKILNNFPVLLISWFYLF